MKWPGPQAKACGSYVLAQFNSLHLTEPDLKAHRLRLYPVTFQAWVCRFVVLPWWQGLLKAWIILHSSLASLFLRLSLRSADEAMCEIGSVMSAGKQN